MTYLIDGHNLIPHVSGLSLGDVDDEKELIQLLSSFSQIKRCQIEVYFDQGQTGGIRDTIQNRVKVHFTLPPVSADDALILRLLGIGRAAKNYTVVSSDQQVRSRARQAGANLMTSQDFAELLINTVNSKKVKHPKQDHQKDEITEWLELFSKHKEEK